MRDILDLTYYPGQDFYCDGEIEDRILALAESGRDVEEILRENNEWAILYHLSDIRENLLDILADPVIQNEMCLSLIREAIEGNGSGTVRSAFETVRSCIGEEPSEHSEEDFRLWSDAELRKLLGEGDDEKP